MLYLGSSTSPFFSRFQEHLTDLNKNEHHCKKLQELWNNNQLQNFSFKIFTQTEYKGVIEQRSLERLWMEKFELFLLNLDKIIDKFKLEKEILSALKNKETYKNISKRLNVSTGWICKLKKEHLENDVHVSHEHGIIVNYFTYIDNLRACKSSKDTLSFMCH